MLYVAHPVQYLVEPVTTVRILVPSSSISQIKLSQS